jgi:6-phosphogluconolactonase
MSALAASRFVLSISLVAASLVACGGGSQPQISPPNPMPAQHRRSGQSAAEFVYVANVYSNNVSGYAVNASDGSLTQLKGSPFATGYGPAGIAIDPTGKFAYVANNGGVSGKPGNVSAFAINAHTGALTQVAGSPFGAGANPIAVAIRPDGKFAYVVNYSSHNVSVFTINAKTGALQKVDVAQTGNDPTALAIDPSGKFVYESHTGFHPDFRSGHLDGYAIDGTAGSLKKIKRAGNATNLDPVSATIDASGKFLYVANYDGQSISAYEITAATGALSAVQGSPFLTEIDPGAVAANPNLPVIYVAVDLGVAAYTVSSAGVLAPVQGSPFEGGYEPDGMAVDLLGKFAFVSVTGQQSGVYAYVVDQSDGALTEVQGSPFSAGLNPAGIAVVTEPG